MFNSCKLCKYFLDIGHNVGTCRRYPQYQNRSLNEICGEFVAKETLPSENEGVFSGVVKELIALPVLEEPPKKRGRPKK